MQEPHSGAAGTDARRAHLLAAAGAVRTWVRDQRAGWSTEAIAPPPPVAPPERMLPVASLPAAPPLLPLPAVEAPAPVEVEIPEPRRARRRKEWQVGATIARAARAIGGPLLRWSIRIAVAVLALAIAGGGGWKALEYWQQRAAKSEQTTGGSAVQPPSTGPSSGPPGTPVRTGQLHVESEPAGAKVFVDGRNRGVTPLTIESLPVGAHLVMLDSAKGMVRRSVTITANETTRISETIYTGWLAVASPIELTISEGAQTLRQDERDQFVLTPGSHELRLESRALGYRETRRVDIRPGEVTRISVTPPASTLTVTTMGPATVTVDGERIGETPISDHPINLGTRDVTVTAASGAVKRFTITVTVAPVRLDVDFSR